MSAVSFSAPRQCTGLHIRAAKSLGLDHRQRQYRMLTHIVVLDSAWLEKMITLEDCVALCGVTEEEVLAIAEHEHIPEIAATALAQYLTYQDHGEEKIRDMIVDDIRASQARNERQRVLALLHVLHHFLRAHPAARPQQHPWSSRF